MKLEDRLKALTRTPMYLEDYRKLKELAALEASENKGDDPNAHMKQAKKMCEKYRLNVPIIPESDKSLPPMFVFTMTVSNYLDEHGKAVVVDLYDRLNFINRSPYMEVTVDFSSPLEDIIQCISTLYKEFSQQVKKKKRSRPSTVDIWWVHDMKVRQKKNLQRITKELFKVTGNPAYCNDVNTKYKRVERAYKKAQKFIKQVEAEASKFDR